MPVSYSEWIYLSMFLVILKMVVRSVFQMLMHFMPNIKILNSLLSPLIREVSWYWEPIKLLVTDTSFLKF